MAYFALYSLRVSTESTLIGSTTVSAPSNASKSSLKEQFSAVQVLVNASGKNASNTFLRPRKADSVTSVPVVEGRVKSGAGSPTRSWPGLAWDTGGRSYARTHGDARRNVVAGTTGRNSGV